jgi:hypothetical protein
MQDPEDRARARWEARRAMRATMRANRGRNLGILLILIGLFALIGTITQSALLGAAFLLGIGVLFLLWGLARHSPGLIIPGCLLVSLGVANGLIELQLVPGGKQAPGGIYTLALGIGFLAVIPFSRLARRDVTLWWAAIPGIFLTGSGIYLLAGVNSDLVNTISRFFFPVVLIVLGIAVLLGWSRRPLTRKPDGQ